MKGKSQVNQVSSAMFYEHIPLTCSPYSGVFPTYSGLVSATVLGIIQIHIILTITSVIAFSFESQSL